MKESKVKNQNKANVKSVRINDGGKRAAINPEKFMKPVKPAIPPKKEK